MILIKYMSNNEDIANANLNLEWEAFLESDKPGVFNHISKTNEEENNSDSEIEDTFKCDIYPKCNNSRKNTEHEYPKCKVSENIDNIPKVTPIYISTKTIISFLNKPIDLNAVFWKLPVIQYHLPQEGIIKKQMKIHSHSKDELINLEANLQTDNCIDQYIISHIDNPTGRIVFKDVRKISIGLCKKDILSYRCKKKSAFYNCFVIILRIFWNNAYKEIHVKVFNTGKLEIPGIQQDAVLYKVLSVVVNTIRAITNDDTLNYNSEKNETVLINSNFNCGYYIDREKLFNLLRYKYRINSCYDPCSYPGIQCEFYYVYNSDIQTGKQPTQTIKKEKNSTDYAKISFMVFRTGSVLIVGKCNEDILGHIYQFIKILLLKEFNQIGIKLIDNSNRIVKKAKIRKKFIFMSKT